jgi:iron complex outermembrane receptor protein
MLMKPLFAPMLGLLACAPVIASPNAPVEKTPYPTPYPLPAVLVSAQADESPLVVQTNPQQARQPIPAMDGADILRTISGFAVVRKGGADGDPVLRGMAGSRLGILLDGGVLLGSCPHRMDPPTAYVFPDAYDKLTVIKGPQSVQYGGGHAAGVVLFDRQPIPADAPAGISGNASLTAGSHGRADAMLDMRYQNAPWQLRASATHTRADDYAAADRRKVHSAYQRHSEMASAAYHPDADTLAELSWVHSDGQAAYADRGMDGAQFARYSSGVKLEKKRLGHGLQALALQLEQQDIDHVMDNYSLRSGTMPAMRMASNPAQRSHSGKLSATLEMAENWLLDVGLDGQQHRHSSRMGMGGMATQMMNTATRQADADISQYGLYAESRWYAGTQRRWISGLRADRWQAQDKRSPMASASAGQKRQEWLGSAFMRLEQDFTHADAKGQWYIGTGYTERAPDYWELLGTGKQSANSNSAFGTRSEKTLQLDAGLQAQYGWGGLHLAAFANRVRDYILIDGDRTDVRFGKTPSGMGGALPQVVRNVQSRSLGLEAGVDYRFNPQWQGEATLAWVRARNLSDAQAMPQIPPLELKLSARYTQGPWQAGVLWRLAAAQTRVAPGKGSIAGLDSSATAGFGVLSVHGSYAITPQWRLDAGIDNLLNKAYAEHLSKAATPLPGYAASGKIPEPGRTLWLKTAYRF